MPLSRLTRFLSTTEDTEYTEAGVDSYSVYSVYSVVSIRIALNTDLNRRGWTDAEIDFENGCGVSIAGVRWLIQRFLKRKAGSTKALKVELPGMKKTDSLAV